ncbi:MAG: tRNA 2-thiouridine(34) synthase MnmA [Candidatus Nomurabacteria bacterium]
MNKNNKTVFVGVSGGVDSSVAAAILKDQGYNVVGVFIRTWSPDFIKCTWKDERRDAMRVCAHLGIPFLECDAEEAYKKGVADYMIEEYKKGNTPNPDVMCNREVKFGVFWQFAKDHGADFIATGHYSRVIKNSFREVTGGGVPFLGTPKNGVKELREKLFFMKRGIDITKDQSYFLWTLTQDDLEHTLFPVGHLEKSEVRKIAKKYKLPTAVKKDSQGVCFLGPLDMKDFLKHYISSKQGDVVNEEGEIIGSHEGAIFFTLGERHGFTIFKNEDNSKPLYVVSKDIENNKIIVSHKSIHPRSNTEENIVLCNDTNWITDIPEKNKNYTSQIRYHGELLGCKIEILENSKAKIIFDKNILVDKGQSVVVYDNDVCLGGCIVG